MYRAIVLAMCLCTASAYGQPPEELIDLTHKLRHDIPLFPGGVAFSLEQLTKASDPYFLNAIRTGEHIGTHVDAPIHFSKGGRDVSQLKLSELSGSLVIIDISNKCAANADYCLSVQDIIDWEHENGRIPPMAIVAVYTGWSAYWSEPKKYVNLDDKGVAHFPGVDRVSATLLVNDRSVAGVCIDTLSVDPGISTSFEAHKIILGSGRFNVENIANLKGLPPKDLKIFILPIPIVGGSGAPARIFATK